MSLSNSEIVIGSICRQMYKTVARADYTRGGQLVTRRCMVLRCCCSILETFRYRGTRGRADGSTGMAGSRSVSRNTLDPSCYRSYPLPGSLLAPRRRFVGFPSLRIPSRLHRLIHAHTNIHPRTLNDSCAIHFHGRLHVFL